MGSIICHPAYLEHDGGVLGIAIVFFLRRRRIKLGGIVHNYIKKLYIID
jgi:hypothetical protein